MLRIFFYFVLFVLQTVPALAFFPGTDEVAQQIEKQTKPLSSFQAILTFPDYPSLSCNLWVKGTTWRKEFIETKEGRPRVVQAILGTDRELLAVFPRQSSAPLPWLLVWKFPLGRWISLGMNPEVKSYQFLINRPCLVLGARDGDMKTVQCWIDNERNIPVRAIWRASSGMCDLIWDAWSQLGNFWLPDRMWFTFNHGTPLQVRIRWNGINIPLQDSLFSRSAFNRKFEGQAKPNFSSPLVSQLAAFPFVVSIRP